MNKNVLAALAIIVAILAAILMFTVWSESAATVAETEQAATQVEQVEPEVDAGSTVGEVEVEIESTLTVGSGDGVTAAVTIEE